MKKAKSRVYQKRALKTLLSLYNIQQKKPLKTLLSLCKRTTKIALENIAVFKGSC